MNIMLKTQAFAPASQTSTPIEPIFQVKKLGKDTLHKVMDLLVEAQQVLPREQAHFLKPQTFEDLNRHSDMGFPIVGVVEENTGKVVAVLLLTPAEHARNLQGYPEHLIKSGTAVVQSVCVGPLFKKRGLMKMLLEGAEQVTTEHGMTRMVAKVADLNQGSTKGFLSCQFKSAAHGRDPKLGYEATFWEKKLDSIATTDITLFNEGYVQSGSSTNILSFATPECR